MNRDLDLGLLPLAVTQMKQGKFLPEQVWVFVVISACERLGVKPNNLEDTVNVGKSKELATNEEYSQVL